jgi:hypothetical protein
MEGFAVEVSDQVIGSLRPLSASLGQLPPQEMLLHVSDIPSSESKTNIPSNCSRNTPKAELEDSHHDSTGQWNGQTK